MEGDLVPGWMSARRPDFYPRPPHGGRHRAVRDESVVVGISIHALRMEGDRSFAHVLEFIAQFLSTPSAWRATGPRCCSLTPDNDFYPRPPRRGRHISSPTLTIGQNFYPRPRVEGDPHLSAAFHGRSRYFYPRPRVEGDVNYNGQKIVELNFYPRPRVEGDFDPLATEYIEDDFYPRPPHGGRPFDGVRAVVVRLISIHALRMEGDTGGPATAGQSDLISIHALRMEGDLRTYCSR